MVSLSKIISALEPSPTLAASARAKELQEQGRDVIALTVGEPDFDTPQHIKDAAVEALKKGFTKYTPVGGIKPLKDAICQKLKRDQDIDAKAAEIVVTNGGKQAIAAACAALLNPGDEVIIPAPYWTSYPDMVKLVDGVPVIVQTSEENGYLLQPEQLERAATPKTKMIILNSPSNPTGACYGEQELQALGDVILKLKNRAEIVVLSDEVYEYITYGGFKQASLLTVVPELRPNTIIVNAFSKTYSMTGWRVGYAFGPKDIIEAMTTHQSQFTSNICSIAQYAAAHAYDDRGAFPRMMQEEFSKRLDLVVRAFAEIPGLRLEPKPRGAFYAFPTLDGLFGKKTKNGTITSGLDFTNYLLSEFDTVVVQGEAFGAPNAFRISFALDTKLLEKALGRIKSAVENLR